jgi:folate-binding protein YgfZ
MGLRAFDVSTWGFVRFNGPDAKDFLQGLVTADMKKLVPGAMLPACVLTPKGMLVADVELYEETPETVLAVVRPGAVIGFLKTFTKMMALSRSTMKCLRTETAWLVIGEGYALGLPWTRLSEPARLLLGVDPPPNAELILPGDFDALRLAAGFPWYGQDMDETTLPLEARQDAAISLDKGCYMGQETVSRIVHRGHVNRRLARLKFPGQAPVFGCIVADAAGEVGRITSSAGPYALAMLRFDAAKPGTKLSSAGSNGEVVD